MGREISSNIKPKYFLRVITQAGVTSVFKKQTVITVLQKRAVKGYLNLVDSYTNYQVC